MLNATFFCDFQTPCGIWRGRGVYLMISSHLRISFCIQMQRNFNAISFLIDYSMHPICIHWSVCFCILSTLEEFLAITSPIWKYAKSLILQRATVTFEFWRQKSTYLNVLLLKLCRVLWKVHDSWLDLYVKKSICVVFCWLDTFKFGPVWSGTSMLKGIGYWS